MHLSYNPRSCCLGCSPTSFLVGRMLRARRHAQGGGTGSCAAKSLEPCPDVLHSMLRVRRGASCALEGRG